jgi:NAD(P)-dependent dehydrogenase (short-subunit alcohol dehydrogenase family)
MKEFKGKIAVITGGASGIGLGIARRCVREGMNVVLADINEVDLSNAEEDLKNRGVTVIGVRTDVSKRGDVQALADRTLETFGAVHLLVNNAGVGAGTSPWESTWNDWEWVIGVDLWGVINGVKIFTPIMVSQNTECHIVNTSSIAGMIAFMHSAPYQVAKHAVVALSENLSVALEKRNALVRVSVLCPGYVKTQTMDSERNRPIDLRDEPIEMSSEQHAMLDAARKAVESGMSPIELAGHVFRAIQEERFYILTHPEEMLSIRERMENILHGRNPRNPSGIT